MLRAIFRAGLFIGAVSSAVYVARRYLGGSSRPGLNNAVDTAKSVAKDVARDYRRKEEPLKARMAEFTGRAV